MPFHKHRSQWDNSWLMKIYDSGLFSATESNLTSSFSGSPQPSSKYDDTAQTRHKLELAILVCKHVVSWFYFISFNSHNLVYLDKIYCSYSFSPFKNEFSLYCNLYLPLIWHRLKLLFMTFILGHNDSLCIRFIQQLSLVDIVYYFNSWYLVYFTRRMWLIYGIRGKHEYTINCL